MADPKTQRQAFSVVVRQHSEQLYWKIRRIVLTHDDADDVLQNTLMKAWANLDTFQNKSKISTWLYRIAMNEALDFLRRQKTTDKVSTDDDRAWPTDSWPTSISTATRPRRCSSRPSHACPRCSAWVFNLRYYDEMKYAEMSQLLHTSEGALKASYHLAVKKISE